jgi:hypothetical protein
MTFCTTEAANGAFIQLVNAEFKCSKEGRTIQSAKCLLRTEQRTLLQLGDGNQRNKDPLEVLPRHMRNS